MADQICYSVLCVFSYIAAGQNHNKRNLNVSSAAQQKSQQQQQQQQAINAHSRRSSQQIQPLPQQTSNKLQTVTVKHVVQPQKPVMTTSTVQPQTKIIMQSPTISSTIQQQQQQHQQQQSQQRSTHLPSSSRSITVQEIKSILPQIPPRILTASDNNSKTTQRGSPPAIPPRAGATGLARSGSVQVSSTSSGLERQHLVRQTSTNSIPPQFTPQPPPPFVIPQRRSSLSRQNSIPISDTLLSHTTGSPGSGSGGGNGSLAGGGGGGGGAIRKH